MSWALMRNPEGLDCDGLDCDVFISHAWQEGIFEFLSKVMHSWPRTSQTVLVVPNRHCSVYTRLWCGHEAYLAQEQGKVILIARASDWKEIWQAMTYMSLAAIVGILPAWLLDFKEWTDHVNLGLICVVVATGVWKTGRLFKAGAYCTSQHRFFSRAILDRSAGNDFLLPGAGPHPQQ
eukprot:s1777_g5.t2